VFDGFVGRDIDVDGIELDEAAGLVDRQVAPQAVAESAFGGRTLGVRTNIAQRVIGRTNKGSTIAAWRGQTLRSPGKRVGRPRPEAPTSPTRAATWIRFSS
jgi:hypothetical protein